MTINRGAAKTLFWAAGNLPRIKTPRRTYEIVSFDPFETERSKGYTWGPCQTSINMLKWSCQLDWDHWDHWALVHNECNPQPCTECGGCRCDGE